ncbi:MAG: glycosyl hydrolase [Sphingomonas sp. SCN 67-18]|uniref:lysozyme n=1 Tax=uncultured Sphingomonas sp. TaxID=158754 RepID=UPI00086A642D|nr:lysozyme [Sphingomonas sp. SCN 67-18]ODU22788.1 MAG: glycosyl hydrolase [Sphingomonas sp. SCN 67-18]
MSNAKTLASVIGFLAAGFATVTVATHEGEERVGYVDIAGIATKCFGDTNDAVVGKRYTREECEASLERQLIAHAEPIMKCTPGLKGRPYATAASVSLAYNIGTKAFCNSTAARRFNAGDVAGGCSAILMWNKAGGRVVQGLVNRRLNEAALCRRDV